VSNNHISLAPLTTRLPLRNEDYEAMNDLSTDQPSYLQSAPTTPHISYRASEPAPTSRAAAAAAAATTRATPRHTSHNTNPSLAKSKSASHLPNGHSHGHGNRHGNRRTPKTPTLLSTLLPDTDFLMRVGSILGSQAHETSLGSGPSWLISRASSASLAGGLPQSPEEYYALQDADEYTLAREKVFGPPRGSRRGSADYTYKTPVAARSMPASAFASPVQSRFGSRSHSRVGGAGGAAGAGAGGGWRSVGRSRPMTPKERQAEILAQMEDDYFGPVLGTGGLAREAVPELTNIPGPDFVNLNEGLEEGEESLDEEEEDLEAEAEAYIQQAKNGFLGSWLMRLFMGDLEMFPSEEDEPAEEEYTEEISDEEFERQRQLRREASLQRLQECRIIPLDTTNDPPPMEDKGGWRDAAWLLGLAVKVIYN
jgi:hypothetical protein